MARDMDANGKFADQDNAHDNAPGHRSDQILLVTGLSGAGKSTALKVLEDLGFEAVDNLPLALLDRLVATPPGDNPKPMAIGIDIRTRDFSAALFMSQFRRTLSAARGGPDVRIAFIDCDDDVLIRRFKETRRRHPLAADRPVMDGIKAERDILTAIADVADFRFDTSQLTAAEFTRMLADNFSLTGRPRMTVSVLSFSYRLGLPREADLVFDVRFLRNPHYVAELRAKTGREADVGAYIREDRRYVAFMEHIQSLILMLLPEYANEGKSYLTIAIGCTGGRHRSVFVAEELARYLASKTWSAMLRHRDS